ncbi:MAG TPA: AMP-binding protein [Tepidisphaeraceae bacterium]|jgi:phenylacetate-CoA ligase|nr:AMP-binding protein [Tepidisphaeraceae bacterium]
MFTSAVDKFIRWSSPETRLWLYEKTPAAVLRSISLGYFRQTVRWAGTHSAFYKRRFAEAGIDPQRVRDPADLKDFYTTPEDIVAHAEEFLCKPPSIVFESSGTSGKNKRVYYGTSELEDMGRMTAAGFSMMGILPADRVANCFDFSIWIPGLLCYYGLAAQKCFVQNFGKVDPSEVYRRMEQYKFTIVMGEPTWLIRLTELAEKNGRFPLKMLIGGAEEMPADAIAWMKDVWQGAKVKMCYGSVEQGSGFGFQPCDQAGGYHIDDLNFLPEIVEADEEGYGELILTTLRREVMPLIRYRTRDVTKMIPDRCACGLRAGRIARLRGRRDEVVVASGGNLYPKLFENILSDVAGLTHDWQVVFKLEGIREVMEINIESTRMDAEEIEAEIRRSATSRYPDMMKNLALGIFDMRIIVHPPGTLRVARKLKRVVDGRHHAVSDILPVSELVEAGVVK